jgi:hypothetical protein
VNQYPANKKSTLRLMVIMALAIIIAKPLDIVFSIKSRDVQILDKFDIPATCRAGIHHERDTMANQSSVGYCGTLSTSFGPFSVVESDTWNPIFMERATMVDSWKVGCTYRIWFYGKGSLAKQETTKIYNSNRTRKIFRSTDLQSCVK